jgi:hypothetical protein
MKFVNIDVDEHGHSFFKDIDLPQYGSPQRISSKNQNVLWWKMSVSQPGHTIDFAKAPDLLFVAVFSGQMDITVSNGETRQFARGDMVTMWDTTGQGHMVRFGGDEACKVLYIALPDKGEFKNL